MFFNVFVGLEWKINTKTKENDIRQFFFVISLLLHFLSSSFLVKIKREYLL